MKVFHNRTFLLELLSTKRIKNFEEKLSKGKTKFEVSALSEKCDVCGKEVFLPFNCNFCGGNFCSNHRLPENHSCSWAPPRTPLGPWKTKTERICPLCRREYSPLQMVVCDQWG